jgi:hypothetical protein
LRWDLWLPGVYLGLVALSVSYLGYRLIFAPTNSEFAGMPLLLLALPWSDWLVPVAGTSGVAGWLALSAGVLFNAITFGLAGRVVGMLQVHPEQRPRWRIR